MLMKKHIHLVSFILVLTAHLILSAPTHSACSLSLPKPSELPDLGELTQEEICNALCHTPTGTANDYFYAADMLVLRQILRDLRVFKRDLEDMIQARSFLSMATRLKFYEMTRSFRSLSYAYCGVDAKFLSQFNKIAEAHNMESPLIIRDAIVMLANDIGRLRNEWLEQYNLEKDQAQVIHVIDK